MIQEPDPGPKAKPQSTVYSLAVLRFSPRIFDTLQSTVTVYSLQQSVEPDPSPMAMLQSKAYSFAVFEGLSQIF